MLDGGLRENCPIYSNLQRFLPICECSGEERLNAKAVNAHLCQLLVDPKAPRERGRGPSWTQGLARLQQRHPWCDTSWCPSAMSRCIAREWFKWVGHFLGEPPFCVGFSRKTERNTILGFPRKDTSKWLCMLIGLADGPATR